MPQNHLKDEEIAMLRTELEMLMKERQVLLRIAGAAAAFVAELDAETLQADTYDAADLLAEFLNAASEETLRDALESVHAHIEGGGESQSAQA